MGNTEVIVAIGVCVAVTASLYYFQLRKKQKDRERLEKEEEEKKKQQNKDKNETSKLNDKTQKDSSSEKPVQKQIEETQPKVTNTINNKVEEIKPATVNVKVDDKQNQNINKPIATSGSIEEIKPKSSSTNIDQTKDSSNKTPKVVDEPKSVTKPKELEKPVDVLTQIKKPEPEVKKPEPEVKKPEPEVKKPEPEVKKPEPEVKKPEPEVKKPEPEVKKPEPEVKKPEPEVKKPEPEVKKPEPEVKKPEPEVKKPEPEVKKPEPEVKKPEPEIKKPETTVSGLVDILKPFNLSDTVSSKEPTDEIVVTAPVVPPQPIRDVIDKEQTEEEINDETEPKTKPVENILPNVFLKKEEPVNIDINAAKPSVAEEKKVEEKKVAKDELKDSGFGKIDLTIFYDENRSKLTINVHSASNLINVDKNSLSDPYVRLVLEPDSKKSTKQKTFVVKDSLNPTWEQIFEWTMTKAETQSKTLEISVKDEKGVFQKQETTFLGRISIDLKNADIYNQALRKWYWLQPEKGIKNSS